MKRILILLLTVAMLFSLISCGEAPQSEGTTATPTETEAAPTAAPETDAPSSAEGTTDTPSADTDTARPSEETTAEEPTEIPTEETTEASTSTEETTTEPETVPPTCTEPTAPACTHEFSEASCTAPATCALCGETVGEKLAHEYTEATCTKRPECIYCGKKRGSTLGHNYENGKCTNCGRPDPYGIKTEGITRVAFIGDSITAGGYWKTASAYLGKTFEYDGFGVSGSTAYAQGLDGNPPKPLAYIDQPAYEKSLKYNPDVVVIMLGTNDSKSINTDPTYVGGTRIPGIKDDNGEQYKQDVINMIRSYQALADAPQVFVALPPTSFRPENGGISNVGIEELIIPLLTAAAEETGAIIIDTHAATKDAPEAFPDGVHPNDDGKALLIQTVTAAILEWKASLDTPAEDSTEAPTI